MILSLASVLVLAVPAFAADVVDADFTPNSGALIRGGAAVTFNVTFNGTTTGDDASADSILFNVTDKDTSNHDILLDINKNCGTNIGAGDNFSAELDFTLKCTSDGRVAGENIGPVTITSAELTCTGSQGAGLGSSDEVEADNQYEVWMQDVPDGDFTGNGEELQIVCVVDPALVPALSEWALALLAVLLLAVASGALGFGTHPLRRAQR